MIICNTHKLKQSKRLKNIITNKIKMPENLNVHQIFNIELFILTLYFLLAAFLTAKNNTHVIIYTLYTEASLRIKKSNLLFLSNSIYHLHYPILGVYYTERAVLPPPTEQLSYLNM